MSMPDQTDDAGMIHALRGGDPRLRGDVLARFQPWLQLLARVHIDSCFRGKFDPSDIVQQTLLEACRALPQFRGQTQAELAAWLRQILAHVLAHEVRKYLGTMQRDLHREVSLEQSLAESSLKIEAVLAAPGSSPSRHAERRERSIILANVLARLPDDYREVIILRNMEGLAHEEIARRMGRGVGAVRMLWVRALKQLRRELGNLSDD